MAQQPQERAEEGGPKGGGPREAVREKRSVGSILAEGFGRGTTAERIHYSQTANGSVEESQYYLRQCASLGLIDRKTFSRLWNLSVAISRMLLSLIAALKRTGKDQLRR